MADKVLGEYKNRLGEVALVPSQGGVFEISLDGVKIYSKLETGAFPDEHTIITQLATKL